MLQKIFWGTKFCSTVYAYTAHLLQCPSVITTKNKLMGLLTTVLQKFWGLAFNAKKFENGVFTPKMHPVHIIHRTNLKTEVSLWNCIKRFPTTLYIGEIDNATISGQFGFVFEENSVREITWSSSAVCFQLSVRQYNCYWQGIIVFINMNFIFWHVLLVAHECHKLLSFSGLV